MMNAMPTGAPAWRRRVIVVLAIAALLAVAAPAEATHRVDERFTVWGKITYTDGAPVPDQTVLVVVAAGRDAVRVRSDAEGWYRKVLAVGNADRGKVFDVKVRDMVTHITVEFDPLDVKTERGKRADFVIRH